ncbi:MAG: HAMP domain-containing sensor histidine kinase [Acidimicrobiales bacterium]
MVPGTTRSGRVGRLSWAASTVAGAKESIVTVVLTRRADPPRPPVGWFLVGGGIALLVGSAVAAWLADSLTRPLRNAQAATLRIAEGDLAIRLPAPAAGDHDEVAELTRSINSMASSLATSRGLERQFLLSVSHDLRTPLTSIRGYADAITDGTITDATDASRVISGEAQRLSRLVADLLDLARLDAHAFSFDLRPVPVAEVVTDAAEGFRPTAEEAGVALVVTEPRAPPPRRSIPTAWPRRSPTSSRTASSTRPRRSGSRRSPAMRATRSCWSPTTGRGSRRATCPTCSSGSTWPTAARSARSAAPASASPSSASSWRAWAVGRGPTPPRGPTAEAHGSPSPSRRRRPPLSRS